MGYHIGGNMVELIAAVCPKCGADLELPTGVSRAYCTYCGRKIILTKSEKHYHMGSGSIDNYYKLGKRAYDACDFAGAIRHLEDGLELDPEHKKVNDLVMQAYYGYAMKLLKRAEGKRQQASDEIVYARRSSARVGSIGDSDHRGVHRHMNSLDDRLDDVHWSRVEQYRGEATQLENKAKIYMKKAGVCPECYGKKWCPRCNGSGICQSCGGSGTKYLIMSCSECHGYRACSTCRGWRYCVTCLASGKYPAPKEFKKSTSSSIQRPQFQSYPHHQPYGQQHQYYDRH